MSTKMNTSVRRI